MLLAAFFFFSSDQQRREKTVILRTPELFRITEHYSLAAEPRADGDKWAWLDSPSTAEETEAGSHPGERTRPRAGRWAEGRFTE